ncbi:MAG: MBG domain-containing protein, partial [Solirubrobacteraceae bacterium]
MRILRRGIAGADHAVASTARGVLGLVAIPGTSRRATNSARLGLMCLAVALAATAAVALVTRPATPAPPRALGNGDGSRALWAIATPTGGAAAVDRAIGLRTSFAAHGGVEIRSGGGLRLGLGSPALARTGGAPRAIKLGSAKVAGSSVTFAATGLREWFVNESRGLEQGFTVAHRPAGRGRLLIVQHFSGDLTGRVEGGGSSAVFSSRAGSLRYANLAVTDAAGRRLPAAIAIHGNQLTIAIDDTGARYPLRVDPTVTPTIEFDFAQLTIDAGGSVGGTVTISGSTSPPTGSVTIYECAGDSSCDTGGTDIETIGSPVTNGDVSTWTIPPVNAPSPQQYCFWAQYPGDGTYSAGGAQACFTADAAPTATGAAPGSADGGASNLNVTISGSGFESFGSGAPNNPAATFSDSDITVNSTTYVSSTQLTANVSVAADATVKSSDVTVTNPDGSSATDSGAFSVDAAPAITSVSPVGTGASDYDLTIAGSGFEGTAGGPAVSFANPGITVDNTTYDNADELTVEVSVAANAGTGTSAVTVTNPDGSTATGTATVDQGPAISSISPDTAAAGASNVDVAVYGSGFASGASVAFANGAVTVESTTYDDPNQLTAEVSVAANATTGLGNVSVTNTDGGSTNDDDTFDVQPPVITVYVAGQQTYGGSGGTTWSPVAYSPSADAGDVTGTLDCSTSLGDTTPAGTYYGTISGCGGLGASGHTIAYSDAGYTVAPAPLTITASSSTMTYGGSVPTISASYSGVENGRDPAIAPTCSAGATSTTPVGSYATTCAGASDPNYTISYAAGTLTVGQAALTITASSPTATYGTVPTISASYSPFAPGDGPGSFSTQPSCTTTDTPTTGVNSAAPSTACSGAVDPNYKITYVDGSVTVDPAPLQVLVSGAQTYSSSPAPSFSIAGYHGFVNGEGTGALSSDSLSGCATTINSSAPPPVAAGSYSGAIETAGCSGVSADNYSVSYVDDGYTVSPASLVITASSPSTTYGTVPAISASYAGFVGSDGPALLTTQPVCFTTDSSSTAPGTAPSYCTGASDPNYTISYVSGLVTIGKAPLTVTASSPTITYGQTAPAIGASYSGFLNGQTPSDLTATPTCSASSGPYLAGTYATTCTAPSETDYAITAVPGTLTVDPAPLQITASSGSFTYGGAVPAVTASYSGFVGTDGANDLGSGLSCGTLATSASAVGSYASTCSGASDANYAITYVNGSVTVNPAALQITASSGSMTYGGSPPTITPSYSTFANSDTSADL